MTIYRIKNDTFDSNCYVLSNSLNNHVIVIDPGSQDNTELLKYIKKNSLIIDFVILTHEHFDHIMGCNNLREYYDFKLVCSEKCSKAIINPRKNLSMYFGNPYINVRADMLVEDINLKLDWYNFKIVFMTTPGHSKGSICFMVDSAIFTGDTLLHNKYRTRRLPGTDKIKLNESVAKLKDIIKNRIIYPGHGDCFEI